MASEYEERIAAVVAKGMAVMCFRNTPIEDFHDRTAPVSHTGDFSDVRGDRRQRAADFPGARCRISRRTRCAT